MRKNFLAILILAFVLSMSSCGSLSPYEKDVKKMANMLCRKYQLNEKDQSDKNVKKEQEKLQQEIDELSAEINQKYGDIEKDAAKQAQGAKILMNVMARCK